MNNVDNLQPESVYFQSNFAWANNLSRVVGFSRNDLLILQASADIKDWRLELVPSSNILRINIRSFRSIYLLIIGTLSAIFALFALYAALFGYIIGIKIYIAPFVCAFFTYFAYSGSLRLGITFETVGKKLKYNSWPGSYDETMSAIHALVEWAKNKNISVNSSLVETANIPKHEKLA